MRALIVRVCGLISGSSAPTRPLYTVPGCDAVRTSTGVPARTRAAADSGSSALIHTEPSPLMRYSGAPIATVMPSRTASSVTTPPIGATIVMRGCSVPVATTRSICSSDMPARRIRCRAPSASASMPAPFIRRTARYSSCAATQSGTYSSSSGWPARTASSGARTKSFSTKPFARACTTAWSRSLNADAADGRERRGEARARRFRRAHADVLLDARIDRDGRRVAAAVGVHGLEHHVHERRLAGLVEALARHHRVVPVQDLAARRRIDVAGLLRRARRAGGRGRRRPRRRQASAQWPRPSQ